MEMLDLERVKAEQAAAFFLLSSRSEQDPMKADERTIMKAMAIRSYAPDCPLYLKFLKSASRHFEFFSSNFSEIRSYPSSKNGK